MLKRLNSPTTAKFSMRAEILKPGDADPGTPDEFGSWVKNQDPLTNQIIRVWVPFPDNPSTPTIDESDRYGTIPCIARGTVDGGVRALGSAEVYGGEYDNSQYVKLWTPPSVQITLRDRVTNIRSKKTGHYLFVDEEAPGGPIATTYNVNAVVPLFGPFNKHHQNFVVLVRAEAS